MEVHLVKLCVKATSGVISDPLISRALVMSKVAAIQATTSQISESAKCLPGQMLPYYESIQLLLRVYGFHTVAQIRKCTSAGHGHQSQRLEQPGIARGKIGPAVGTLWYFVSWP